MFGGLGKRAEEFISIMAHGRSDEVSSPVAQGRSREFLSRKAQEKSADVSNLAAQEGLSPVIQEKSAEVTSLVAQGSFKSSGPEKQRAQLHESYNQDTKPRKCCNPRSDQRLLLGLTQKY